MRSHRQAFPSSGSTSAIALVNPSFVRIEVEALRPGLGRLELRYLVTGAIDRLVLPAPGPPERTDGLWQSTCFEAFVRASADAGYFVVGQTVFESLFGGKEVAAILERPTDEPARQKWEYKLVATKRTSTLQKELQEANAVRVTFYTDLERRMTRERR